MMVGFLCWLECLHSMERRLSVSELSTRLTVFPRQSIHLISITWRSMDYAASATTPSVYIICCFLVRVWKTMEYYHMIVNASPTTPYHSVHLLWQLLCLLWWDIAVWMSRQLPRGPLRQCLSIRAWQYLLKFVYHNIRAVCHDIVDILATWNQYIWEFHIKVTADIANMLSGDISTSLGCGHVLLSFLTRKNCKSKQLYFRCLLEYTLFSWYWWGVTAYPGCQWYCPARLTVVLCSATVQCHSVE